MLLLLLAFWIASAPAPPRAYEAPIDREERARNAALLTALAAAGITTAWVDAGEERVLAVYEPAENVTVEDSQRYVLGAAAVVAPRSVTLTARTTTGVSWTVATADVLALHADALDEATLETRVAKTYENPVTRSSPTTSGT